QLLTVGMEQEILPPKLVAAKYKTLTEPFMHQERQTNILMKPFTAGNLSKGSKGTELGNQIWETIEKLVIPAYNTLDSFMVNHYIPACPEQIGVGFRKGGKSYYEQKVRYYTTLPMSPDQVYDLGLVEVVRI